MNFVMFNDIIMYKEKYLFNNKLLLKNVHRLFITFTTVFV